jgi:hypothetical protein
MEGLLNTNSAGMLEKCLKDATLSLENTSIDRKSAKLTLAALIRFSLLKDDKPAPLLSSKLKEAVVRTGAYYFGPMFVLNKGTSVPSNKLLQELSDRGLYTTPLKHMNNAQLNLFFITLKCIGLVSDKHLIGYVKYGV